MTFDEYQEAAHATSKNTSIGGDTLLYPTLGLAGETGEFVDKIKKLYRDHNGKINEGQRAALVLEIGDLQWYLSELATQLGVKLSFIAEMNLAKLADRADRGVIGGSGDNR